VIVDDVGFALDKKRFAYVAALIKVPGTKFTVFQKRVISFGRKQILSEIQVKWSVAQNENFVEGSHDYFEFAIKKCPRFFPLNLL
jgi:hypothetical protein